MKPYLLRTYPIVIDMKEVRLSLDPQLMADLGDVSRFTYKGIITALVCVDPGMDESDIYEQKMFQHQSMILLTLENFILGNGCFD